jgi:hypothetical protein
MGMMTAIIAAFAFTGYMYIAGTNTPKEKPAAA